MSNLIDLKITDFLDTLASSSPAPGGGSVAALCGAHGASLCAMVCRLTIGREKYAEHEVLCNEVLLQIEDVRAGLTKIVDTDTEAYNEVVAAFKLPKSTEDEKTVRANAIQASTIGATAVPYHTMELALAGLKLTKRIMGKSNTNASSDLGVAISCFKTAIEGGKLNVLTNTPGIKDDKIRADFEKNAENIMSEAAQF